MALPITDQVSSLKKIFPGYESKRNTNFWLCVQCPRFKMSPEGSKHLSLTIFGEIYEHMEGKLE